MVVVNAVEDNGKHIEVYTGMARIFPLHYSYKLMSTPAGEVPVPYRTVHPAARRVVPRYLPTFAVRQELSVIET